MKLHTNKTFALVDCNNFYASCERVFNPALQHKPIVVLSNNDGCIVSRSNEAKALGIPMGAPYHHHKALIEKNGVAVFSSNYQLYGDMSRRVMDSLHLLVHDMEVYSIDEAFLGLDELPQQNLYDMAVDMRSKLYQWTGIPTSFGIAPTKTLAKIANHMAKKHTCTGIFDMRDPKVHVEIMRHLPVESLWGISHRWGRKLRTIGIQTALQLRDADPKFIRKHFNVVAERMVQELRGHSCLDLEEMTQKKNILSSKSFGTPLTELRPMEEALANYAARACEKLRAQHSKAQGIYVFVKTNPFQHTQPQYRNGFTQGFDYPTSDTAVIIQESKKILKMIYREGFKYHKCGIMLLDLVGEDFQQGHLFVQPTSSKRDHLMKVLDGINQSLGSNSVFHAAEGTKRAWKMRCDKRSNRYTTQWKELPIVL